MDPTEYNMNFIAILLSGIAIVASIIMGIVALVVSKNIAKKYGDLAGSQAAINYEERKAAEARKTALRALGMRLPESAN